MAGVSPFVIAAILGHTTIQMTGRYTHASPEARRQAVEALKQKSEPERPALRSVK